MGEVVYKSSVSDQPIKRSGKSIIACVSSSKVDRDFDTMRIEGIQFDTYLKMNPVLAWAHNYQIPAIGRCERLWRDQGNTTLYAELTFGSSEFAREIEQMYTVDRTMSSFSIGFRILSSGPAGREIYNGMPLDLAQTGKSIRVIHSCELLEISAAVVPSQADAVTVRLEQKGFLNNSRLKESITSMASNRTRKSADNTATPRPTSTAEGMEICPKCSKPRAGDVCKCNGGAQGNANGIAAADAVKRMQTAISGSLTEEQRLELAVRHKLQPALEDGTLARTILEQVATQCEIFSAVKQLGDVLGQCRDFAVKVDTERQLLEPGGKHGSTLAAKSQGYGVCPFRAGTSEAMIWAHEQKSLRRKSR
jgi:hypothetical protein